MVSYLKRTKVSLIKFKRYTLEQIRKTLNTYVDALACLDSASSPKLGRLISVELFPEPTLPEENKSQLLMLKASGWKSWPTI